MLDFKYDVQNCLLKINVNIVQCHFTLHYIIFISFIYLPVVLFFFSVSLLLKSHTELFSCSSGMFANAEGVSQRAPVSWSESVIGAAVCFPYVVALDESFITIHSMLDQQLKQTLSFRDGHILQDFEGILKQLSH